MIKAIPQEPQVTKKGTTIYFTKGGEEIFSLRQITFTYKEKLERGLSEMIYFLPSRDFERSEVELPKNDDTENLEKYNLEREDLATWKPIVMYMKAEDKKKMATRLCSELMQINPVPEVFLTKFTEILDEFSDILTKFLQNGNNN